MAKRRRSEEERFWAKVQVNELTGCWEWNAGIKKDYARFVMSDDSKILSHVWAYLYCIGDYNRSLDMHHNCDNPACVNPKHLEPMEHDRHMILSSRNQCTVNSMKLYCKYGHMMAGENIAWSKGKNGKRYRHCLICQRIYKRDRMRALRAKLKS
jgi:hypothetical protein